MKTKKLFWVTCLVLISTVFTGNAQQWSLTGNAGTDPATNYVGTSDGKPLVFKISNAFSGTLGTGYTSFGYGAMSVGGNSNSAFGVNALHNSGASIYNSAFGTSSLLNNTTGSYNTALGVSSMVANITGTNNIAIGYHSLRATTNSTGNIAIGFESMGGLTGDSNIAIGYRAFQGSTANGAIGIGNGVLANSVNTPSGESTFNVAVGNEAGFYLSTGTKNSFFGRSSGRGSVNSNTGSSNSFFGYDSGINISSGNLNSFFGFFAGNNVTTGGYNSFFGNQSGLGLTAGNWNTFIGSVVVPSSSKTATSAGYDTNRTIILADGAQQQRLFIHENGFTGIGLGNNVIPKNTLEIRSIGGSPSASGLRFTNLLSSSASISNTTNKVLSVNATGDVILVDDKQGNGGSSPSENIYNSNGQLTGERIVDMNGNNLNFESYSPILTLKRNRDDGGFIQGIQTKLMDGTNNWYFGNLNVTDWVVAKGVYSNPKLTVKDNGNVGIGAESPSARLEVKSDIPNVSGLKFTNLTSAFAPAVANNKFLTVNNLGEVVLENISTSGGAVDQTLTLSGNNLSISNGNTVTLPTLTEVDGDITNELQTLSEDPTQTTGTAITLSNGGGTVYVDGSETQIQAGTNVTVTGSGTLGSPYVINSTATGSTDINIYKDNGALTSNRIVTMGNNNLIFNTSGNTTTTGGRIYIGNTTAFTAANFPTTTGDYRLNVEGGILTEKVKVALRSTANWADYVFANDYKLMPLHEVETFVKTNKHLPGVSSAENLVKEGLDLGAMQAKQMQKIEELTLYAIEQNKTIEKQSKEIEELKVLVNALVNKNK